MSLTTRRATRGSGRLRAALLAVAATVGSTSVVHADGAAPLPLPVSSGCFGLASYGIGMYGTGVGSVDVAPPGPILGVYIHWVGVEDDTPGGVGDSTLTINGVDVVGTLTTPPADHAPRPDWFSWWANIGPAAGPFLGLDLVTDAARRVDVSGWDPPAGKTATNGATVTVIYDIGACIDPTTIAIDVGVDWYFQGDAGQELSELLVFAFPPAPIDRLVSFHVAHAGTDATQGSCRGGAVWMVTGTGAAPGPGAFDLADFGGGGRGFGINGGVEVVNDPYTSAALPCVVAINPPPDEPYEPGHPCPLGASACPYQALAMRPTDGGDVGAEWGVIELDVRLPANAEWVAFQLESEKDESGESGSWSGASYVLAALPVCGDGRTEPGEECDDGNTTPGDGCDENCRLEPNRPPQLVCVPCERCNDPGLCAADFSCDALATACDPDGDPVVLTCDPPGPYPVGSTDVRVVASDGIATVELVCPALVRDCEPPTCIAPPELLLECGGRCGTAGSATEIEDWLGRVTASDNCGVVSIDDLAPPLFASGCGAGTTTTVGFIVRDGVDLLGVCTADVTVADSTPPEVTVVLEPVEPLPPQEPVSVCSAPTERVFRIGCEVTDGCGEVTVEAHIVREGHVTDGDTCEPTREEVEVECGELVELRLLKPPCPAGKPPSAPSSQPNNDCGQRVFEDERVYLEVRASDGCGNETVVIYDPTVEPSELCEVVLEDGTCCPPLGAPPDDCKGPCDPLPPLLRATPLRR